LKKINGDNNTNAIIANKLERYIANDTTPLRREEEEEEEEDDDEWTDDEEEEEEKAEEEEEEEDICSKMDKINNYKEKCFKQKKSAQGEVDFGFDETEEEKYEGFGKKDYDVKFNCTEQLPTALTTDPRKFKPLHEYLTCYEEECPIPEFLEQCSRESTV
jgi:hypothetical protein